MRPAPTARPSRRRAPDHPGRDRGEGGLSRTRSSLLAITPRRRCGFEPRLRHPGIGARLAALLLERGYTLLAVLPLVPSPERRAP
jgi:hypothetical protein